MKGIIRPDRPMYPKNFTKSLPPKPKNYNSTILWYDTVVGAPYPPKPEPEIGSMQYNARMHINRRFIPTK